MRIWYVSAPASAHRQALRQLQQAAAQEEHGGDAGTARAATEQSAPFSAWPYRRRRRRRVARMIHAVRGVIAIGDAIAITVRSPACRFRGWRDRCGRRCFLSASREREAANRRKQKRSDPHVSSTRQRVQTDLHVGHAPLIKPVFGALTPAGQTAYGAVIRKRQKVPITRQRDESSSGSGAGQAQAHQQPAQVLAFIQLHRAAVDLNHVSNDR